MVFPFSSSPFHKDPKTYATPAPSAAPKTAAEAQLQLKQYDYIIIGAGTAGSVLASRLTEDGKTTVLVIEAGYENTPLECKVPLTFGKLFHSKYDWDYNTTPQNDNLHKREMFWPRGKILGGSSSINAMMYQEGARTDYQEWEERLGCKGYGPEEMKAYHRRVENYTPNKNRPALDHAHRSANAGGVLQTSHSWLSEITEKGFLEGAKTIGLKEVKDINTPDELSGVVRFMTFIDQKGQRSSAATAYLPPAVQRRPNLTIALETRVTRILFDTSSGKEPEAIGVEVQTDPKNPLFQVAARKEVLVCGGTINTPQTLLLSGVGPAEELRKHNLPVIVESPNVGKRMKDHLFTSPICVRSRPDKTLDYLTSDVRALPALGRWLTTGTGPLTSNVGEVAAFFNTVTDKRLPTTVEGVTKEENKPENNGSMGVGPDIEVIATPLCYRDHGAVTAPSGHGILGFVPIGLRPRSEGTVTLKTTSVWDKALIDPKYLSDEKNNDQKVLLAGLRVCIKIMQSEAIQQYALPVEKSDDIDNFYWPYCATDYDKITDEQLLTWLGKEACTLYHPVSTCALGPNADDVLDLEMKLRGAKGLRVVDASVFPQQISGHPTSVVLALAEKAADLIMGRSIQSSGAPIASSAAQVHA